MSAHVDDGALGLERLASATNCAVYRCSGGCLHVQIGATTLRVSEAMLRELSEVVNKANLFVMGGSDRYAH